MSQPLVSCLCPTADRREFMPQCFQCFTQQNYPNLELIVLDDGKYPIQDLVPDDPRIKYVYSSPKKNHGQKMNQCMELAKGGIAIVFDDDDFYSPDRVTKQIQPLLDNPNIDVTGTSRLYYYIYGTHKAYRYQNWTTQKWLGAIAFRRSVWEKNKFQSVSAGADVFMLNSIPQERWYDLNDLSLLVATIHLGNTGNGKTLPSISYIDTPWEKIEKIIKGTL